jgi:DNA replication protein DnaC
MQYQLEMKTYQEPDFLILDEVTESISKDGILSEVERQVFRMLIDERHNYNRPSLIISNRNTQEIALRFGKDIMDRLSKNSISLIFNWPSYRQQ